MQCRPIEVKGTYCTDEGGEIGRGFTVVVSMKDREGQEDVTQYTPQVVKQVHRNYNITVNGLKKVQNHN